MRTVAPLALFFCLVSISTAPDLAPPDMVAIKASGAAVADSGAADYKMLQHTADLALEALRQSRERRLAAGRSIAR